MVVVEDATFSAGRIHERALRRMTQAAAEWNPCKGPALEWLRTVDYETSDVEGGVCMSICRRLSRAGLPEVFELPAGSTSSITVVTFLVGGGS